MKILVIGAGSMGRRRLRDLSYLNPGGVLLLETIPERCAKVAASFGVSGYHDVDAALQQRPSALVVSTPPAFHEAYVRRGIKERMHVFAEVPFVLDHQGLKEVAKQRSKDNLLAVSHTIRYYPPYRLIHDLLASAVIGRPLYLEYSLGNYLPDWHPYEDYRKFYAHDQKLGGAGMDMLLHELSAIHWWLGSSTKVLARLTKVSSLEIAGPDTHDLLLWFASGAVGFFHHDVIERGTVGRHIRIVGEEGTIEWHQNQSSVRVYRAKNSHTDEIGFEQAGDWQAAIEASREAAQLIAAQRPSSGHIPASTAPSFTYESCYLREMRHYLDAAINKAEYRGCTITEELVNVATFHAALESAKQGREIVVA